jgi:hypothetical protein
MLSPKDVALFQKRLDKKAPKSEEKKAPEPKDPKPPSPPKAA